MRFLPALAQRGVEAVAKCHRQFIRLAILIERDGLADVVHDHLAGAASGHVLLEIGAEARVNRAVHVFVQQLEQFFTLHDMSFQLH
jgi:hypothetical protein